MYKHRLPKPIPFPLVNALLLGLVLAVVATSLWPASASPATQTPAGAPTTPAVAVEGIQAPPATPTPTSQVALPVAVYDADAQALVTMDLEEYVARVVWAEIPASYEPAAIQAQAVAARTRAVRQLRSRGGPGCAKAEGADVCTRFDHCQAYLSPEARRAQWGAQADEWEAKVRACVAATSGQILLWEGQPIEVFYHAASGGKTEDAAHVFSQSLPYLVSVSSQGESGEAAAAQEQSFSRADFVSKVHRLYPKARLSASQLENQVAILSRNESDRVDAIRVGQVDLTGVQLRQALGLRSANFTFRVTGDAIVFTTQGYGHGVGMSQAGAQAMALSGQTYVDILTHYYPGVTLAPLA